MPRRRLSTGNPDADAKDDFDLARQREVLSRLGRWVRRQPDDVNSILPFDEVVAALGRSGERDLGLQPIRLDTVVGTVDRVDGAFDRDFLPTSTQSRERWVRSAAAMRRGEPLEPISVYRVGEAHFVRDGHHRVSVAKAARLEVIDAFVIEILTRTGTTAGLRLTELPLKTHERLFFERVPLTPEQRARIRLDRAEKFASLAEGAEAWGFRAIQALERPLGRSEVAQAWFREEYEPAIAVLREAGLIRSDETETDAYCRLAEARYLLLRTHSWDAQVIEKLRGEV
ncbi:MAG TPA: hypothetical protein VM942_09935 [Acidimicrobiales bacterium]|nr:hypothetical protein [Acidimicrobiales bacterium]